MKIGHGLYKYSSRIDTDETIIDLGRLALTAARYH